MVRSECVFFAAALAAALSQAAAGDEFARVGAYGEPWRLAIEGASSYKPNEIASALAVDLDLAYASCADHPLAELKALLADKVRQAYLQDGFADVRLEVRQEPSRLVLSVAEGRRFHAGEVRIVGARSIDVPALIDGLTTKRGKKLLESELTGVLDGRSEKPNVLWHVGEPARLCEIMLDRLRQQVENLLHDQGRFGARFSLAPDIDRQRGAVSLRIMIADEGVRRTARDLAITGIERNSREAVLNYLGLLDDSALTAETRSQIEKALNESGRFQKVLWRDSSDATRGPPRLELVEYDQAPPLDEPLSREEEALLNLYHWTQQFNGGADEIAIDLGGQGFQSISAPRFGLIAWVGGLPGARPPLAGDPSGLDLAFVSTDAEIGLYSYRRGHKLAWPMTPAPVMLLLGLTLANGPPRLDGEAAYTIGVGGSTSDREKRRYCELRFNQSAVGAVSLAHQKDAEFHWQGDVLTIRRKDFEYVIDAPTGRLLSHVVKAEGGASQSLQLRFSHNEFEPKLRRIKTLANRFENFASPRFPLSCTAAYACDEAAYWASPDNAAVDVRWVADLANAVRKLVDNGLFVPFDRAIVAPKSPDPEFRLVIPIASVNSQIDLPGTIRFLMHVRGIRHGDRLAPRGSWPWQMAREAMFVAAGKRDRLARVLDALKSDSSGPIRCLAASLLLDRAGYEVESRDVARAGLKNASLTQFQNEYRPLLARGYYAGDGILRLAEMLRELDEEEIRALVRGATELGLLDERGGDLLAEAIRRLRSRPGEPIDRLLPIVLDDLWAAGLRECLEQALESAAAIPPETGSFEWAQQQLEKLDRMRQMLQRLNLPPEEFERQLKELDVTERMLRAVKPSPKTN